MMETWVIQYSSFFAQTLKQLRLFKTEFVESDNAHAFTNIIAVSGATNDFDGGYDGESSFDGNEFVDTVLIMIKIW
jgi:hypothetical protein